jgi:hypothetical protein
VQGGAPASGANQGAAKIQHARPGIGQAGANAAPAPGQPSPGAPPRQPQPPAPPPDPQPLSLGAESPPGPGQPKITAFGRDRRHEESWQRTPNTTGSGAIHVKTFSCKLTEDALQYMDQAINEWLDAHPQYEVKFVSTSIGTMTGKLKEPALICQVWV